ncbi:MAG: uracil-DNA glycosylase [Spirochaetaceae bacterium]|nr:uracil-DNA glycosylase [Spirochaetaceae bacterium]
MTAQEKSLLYSLLNNADCLYSGRVSSDFAPADFKDDADIAAPVSATAPDSSVQDAAVPDAAAEIKKIALDIAQCTGCVLCKARTNTVPGIGKIPPVVLVIGEGPGADEDRTGEPFVGKAGQLLDKMLAAIQLSREDNCFIANIVKCRPPANRTPLPEEAQACAKFLQAQIDVLKPKMILAVGNTALHNLLGTTTGIKKLHGKFFNYQGIPLLATFHPSALLRDESLKRPAWEDLKIFRSKLLEIVPDYQASYLNGGSV